MKNSSQDERRQHAAYATETSGLLLVALLVLILTVIRYWQAIRWSMH